MDCQKFQDRGCCPTRCCTRLPPIYRDTSEAYFAKYFGRPTFGRCVPVPESNPSNCCAWAIDPQVMNSICERVPSKISGTCFQAPRNQILCNLRRNRNVGDYLPLTSLRMPGCETKGANFSPCLTSCYPISYRERNACRSGKRWSPFTSISPMCSDLKHGRIPKSFSCTDTSPCCRRTPNDCLPVPETGCPSPCTYKRRMCDWSSTTKRTFPCSSQSATSCPPELPDCEIRSMFGRMERYSQPDPLVGSNCCSSPKRALPSCFRPVGCPRAVPSETRSCSPRYQNNWDRCCKKPPVGNCRPILKRAPACCPPTVPECPRVTVSETRCTPAYRPMRCVSELAQEYCKKKCSELGKCWLALRRFSPHCLFKDPCGITSKICPTLMRKVCSPLPKRCSFTPSMYRSLCSDAELSKPPLHPSTYSGKHSEKQKMDDRSSICSDGKKSSKKSLKRAASKGKNPPSVHDDMSSIRSSASKYSSQRPPSDKYTTDVMTGLSIGRDDKVSSKKTAFKSILSSKPPSTKPPSRKPPPNKPPSSKRPSYKPPAYNYKPPSSKPPSSKPPSSKPPSMKPPPIKPRPNKPDQSSIDRLSTPRMPPPIPKPDVMKNSSNKPPWKGTGAPGLYSRSPPRSPTRSPTGNVCFTLCSPPATSCVPITTCEPSCCVIRDCQPMLCTPTQCYIEPSSTSCINPCEPQPCRLIRCVTPSPESNVCVAPSSPTYLCCSV